TCSSCHAAADAGGAVAPGVPNARLDLGAAILAAQGRAAALSQDTHASLGAPIPAARGIPAGLWQDPPAAWAPGRLDVTTATGTEPARIPDLRPVRFLSYLQQDATVRARDLTTLAIRIATL